jgi:hypothetical protein
MEKKEISQLIIGVLNDPEYKISLFNELYKLSSEIVKEMKYKEDSKIRVLNLFLLTAHRSFNSFVTLLENSHYTDAFLLTRKIAEILIRIDYLSTTKTFDNYFRERSIEQAKMLHSILNAHPIKHISQSTLWKKRHEIIAECKEIYNDQKSGKFENTPNVEQMAEKIGMLVLYKKTYGVLSKFVHSNISIENFYLYELDKKLYYYTEDTDGDFKKSIVKGVIDDTLYYFYLIIVKYCSELGIRRDQIANFNKEFFLFVSMDLVTGRSKSNVDITLNLHKNLTGIDISKEENDLVHEVMFVEEDITSLKDSWTKLEALIKKKEGELQNL